MYNIINVHFNSLWIAEKVVHAHAAISEMMLLITDIIYVLQNDV